MSAIWHIGFVIGCAHLEHPRTVFGGLCCSAKFVRNRCSCFDNIQIVIFFVRLENAYPRPQNGSFGNSSPIWAVSINATSKMHLRVWKYLMMYRLLKVRPWMWAGRDKQRLLMLLNRLDKPQNCPFPLQI